MSAVDVPVQQGGTRTRLGFGPARIATVLAVFLLAFGGGYVGYGRYLAQTAPVRSVGPARNFSSP